MLTSMKSALPLAAALVALAGCSGGESDALKKDVEELRADLQRTQKENEKLRTQVASAEGRINGLAEDLARVRNLSIDVKAAPAPQTAAEATDEAPAGGGAAPGLSSSNAAALLASPQGVAIKNFLATEDGKKVLEAAIQADRDARAREQDKRRVDGLVDRFAKTAGLTDDQTKRMKDILEKQADATRDAWASLQLGPDPTQEQRDDRRKQGTTKVDEIRKSTDDQLRAVLSSTQFDAYQQEQDRSRQTMRGTGGGNNGRRNSGGNANAGGRGNNANGN
jgi:hypothetical protein